MSSVWYRLTVSVRGGGEGTFVKVQGNGEMKETILGAWQDSASFELPAGSYDVEVQYGNSRKWERVDLNDHKDITVWL